MKQRIIKTGLTALLALSLLTGTALASGNTVYTNTRQLADNLELINTVGWSSEFGRTEDFAIAMTGPGDAYPIIMKGDTVFGSNKISSMVSYAESLGKNVLAVANSDFFFEENGVPLGIVVEDGVYKSSPGERNAVSFGYDGSVNIIPSPTVWISLVNNGGAAGADNAGKTVNMRNFNKTRTDTGGMCLYSEAFSTVSTRTSTPGWFVRFKILDGTPSVSGTMDLEVTEAGSSDGAISIGEGYLILTAADLSGADAEFEKFAVGDTVTLTTTCDDARLASAQYATGGGDVIVSDGAKTDAAGWTASLMQRAPRTAFGIREDGTVITYVVDGRNTQHSVGMTLDELADEMLRQGCVYAVNFDGGGSSALSVRIPGEGETALLSQPSDGFERGCATYILFVTDAVPDGAVKNLSLANDGTIVLAGSSVELSFAATDGGYMPAAVPEDISVDPIEPGATIDGNIYTAGSAAGADRLALYSPSTGAAGTGEIYVITRPTSITATRKDGATPLTSVRIAPGDTLEFDVTATYYRRTVTSQLNSFTYDITGDIGEMTAPGVFTAGQNLLQNGAITVSAGGRSTDIQIEISGFTDMVGHWAKDYAEYLLQMGISNGISPTQYGPSLEMRRADYILMLYRAAGQPQVDSMDNFDDTPSDAYYWTALAWAKATGIADTPDDNMFDPASPLTRQDAFTFTYRALGILNKQYTDGTAEDLAGFPDAGDVDDYAVIPTATLIRLGIVDGMGGILSPRTTMTRAQMAKVITTVLEL